MTYSLAFHHVPTGTVVAAVASHFPAVGAVVPWVGPHGAVLTQAVGDPNIGIDGLELLAQGFDAQQTVGMLLDRYGQRQARQIVVVPTCGAPAVHTGAQTLRHAGHVTFATGRFVGACAGNMMSSPAVWETAAAHVRQAHHPDVVFVAVNALQRAAGQGGDVRGQMAAAVAVYETDRPVWHVRVDDASEPLAKLERATHRARAYQSFVAATQCWESDVGRAATLMVEASLNDPFNDEISALCAAASWRAGQESVARAALSRADTDVASEVLRRVRESGWLTIPRGLLDDGTV